MPSGGRVDVLRRPAWECDQRLASRWPMECHAPLLTAGLLGASRPPLSLSPWPFLCFHPRVYLHRGHRLLRRQECVHPGPSFLRLLWYFFHFALNLFGVWGARLTSSLRGDS